MAIHRAAEVRRQPTDGAAATGSPLRLAAGCAAEVGGRAPLGACGKGSGKGPGTPHGKGRRRGSLGAGALAHHVRDRGGVAQQPAVKVKRRELADRAWERARSGRLGSSRAVSGAGGLHRASGTAWIASARGGLFVLRSTRSTADHARCGQRAGRSGRAARAARRESGRSLSASQPPRGRSPAAGAGLLLERSSNLQGRASARPRAAGAGSPTRQTSRAPRDMGTRAASSVACAASSSST